MSAFRVITEAGNNPKVKALVHVAAFAPKPGESVNSILSAFRRPEWFSTLHADAGGYVTWPIASWVSEFATATAAWSTRPVFSVVARQDRIIPAPLQMLFAQQMHATVVPVETGHLAMLIDPENTAKAIIAAANAY